MKPRVLHAIEAIEAGVARHVTDLVRLVDADHHVVVPPERVGGFTDDAALAAMRAAGAEVHMARMRRSVAAPGNLAAAVAVRRLVRSAGIDVVHGHASIGGAVARLGAIGTGAARVYTPNGLLPARGALAAERLLGRLTDRFVAVSASEAEQAERLGVIGGERIVVIPNGIDLEPPPPSGPDLRELLGVDPGTPLVGTIGRLAAQKAPEAFIAACERAGAESDAGFVLIGDGPLRDEVARRVAASPLGSRLLHLPGLPGASGVLPQLDAFVLASRYEAGPYAPLEAMRAGVPAVLTDVVGNRDAVADGDSGLLVAPGDPDALAAAIGRLLADGDLRAKLAEGGRRRLEERFDVREMARRTSELYAALAAGPTARRAP